MKVTFSCEKCGHEFAGYIVVVDPSTKESAHVAREAMRSRPPCPNCAKLQYGPLTEEMVAEALSDAWVLPEEEGWPTTPVFDRRVRQQARFVLRLLNAEREDKRIISHMHCNLRAWLLDLARKK